MQPTLELRGRSGNKKQKFFVTSNCKNTRNFSNIRRENSCFEILIMRKKEHPRREKKGQNLVVSDSFCRFARFHHYFLKITVSTLISWFAIPLSWFATLARTRTRKENIYFKNARCVQFENIDFTSIESI